MTPVAQAPSRRVSMEQHTEGETYGSNVAVALRQAEVATQLAYGMHAFVCLYVSMYVSTCVFM